MPAVTILYPDESWTTVPSGAGSWLIPVFLVGLIFGVVVVVIFSKPSLRLALRCVCRRILCPRRDKDVVSESKSAPSDRALAIEPEGKMGSQTQLEAVYFHCTDLVDTRSQTEDARDRSLPPYLLSDKPVDPCSIQHNIPVLCSAFSDDSLCSLPAICEEDGEICRPPDDRRLSVKGTADDSMNPPQLLFTPPTFENLASLSIPSVQVLETFLQPPRIDQFGHAIPDFRSIPSFSDPAIARTKSRTYQPRSVAGKSSVDLKSDGKLDEELIPKLSAALSESRQIAEGLQNEATPISEQTQRRQRRNSMTMKVSVPSTNDLWKLWVSRSETLEHFAARVREKVGVDVALFTHTEESISEDEWRFLKVEHKVIARPL